MDVVIFFFVISALKPISGDLFVAGLQFSFSAVSVVVAAVQSS